VTGRTGQVGERPHAGPTRNGQPPKPGEAGSAKSAGKRAKQQVGGGRGANVRPEPGTRRSDENKDDSDDEPQGPGGSGGARPTPSNTDARSRSRARSRDDSSDARFEVDEPGAAESGEEKEAETRAIDTWADEIVRRSHGAKTITSLFEEEDDDVPGPLTRAASAARIEAEARIRAAMMQADSSRTRHRDSGDDPAWAESELAEAGDEDRPDIAAAWGSPALTLRQISESGVTPQDAPSEDFDDADDDDEPPPAEEDRRERSLASYVRRSRIARGYPIPRLPRSKRSGAVPGL